MGRSSKSKLAITLLGTLAFGASAWAQNLNKNQIAKADGFQINSTNSVQNSGKLGRVTIDKTESIDWKKIGEIGSSVFVGAAVFETAHSAVGVFTDLPIGKGSLGRWIKERGKKDNQHWEQLPDQTRLWKDNKHQESLSNPGSLDSKSNQKKLLKQINTGQFFKQNMSLVENMASTAEYKAGKDWFGSWALCFVENAPKYMAENSYPKLISMCKGELILKGFKVLQCKNFYFAFLVDNEVYVVLPSDNNGKCNFKVTIDDRGAISTKQCDWNTKPCVLETLKQDAVDEFLSSSNSHIINFVVE